MGNPEYPARALANNVQGRVDLEVQIGADGKVMFAHAVGADPILEKAAEDNVRTWEFGPFPPVAQFPVYDIITYEFKLKGPPVSVGPLTPTVRTDLPNHVVIESRLMFNDLAWPIKPEQPPAQPRAGDSPASARRD
jgi:TonB family protein